MLKNADCTLYLYDKNNGGFIRYFISDVYWHESKAQNVLKSGLSSADSTTVYLYNTEVVPKTPSKDMLVKGDCSFEFDNTSSQTVSKSMAEFRKQFDFVTVSSVDDVRYGGLPHIEISAK